MAIDIKDVDKIASLARLYFDDGEKGTFLKHFQKTVDYIEKLNEIDTSDVPPTSHVIDIKNVTRDDAPISSLPPDEILSNAPDRMGDFYRVPKIIEQGFDVFMFRCMLRAKIHMATVTASELQYEGSITIDGAIMKKADIKPFEQVQVSNLNNGERFETYAIPGNKGEICLNGPTARKGAVGDRIIIFSYAWMEDSKTSNHRPVIIKLDEKNRVLDNKK